MLAKPPNIANDSFKSAKWDELTAGRGKRLKVSVAEHILHFVVGHIDEPGIGLSKRVAELEELFCTICLASLACGTHCLLFGRSYFRHGLPLRNVHLRRQHTPQPSASSMKPIARQRELGAPACAFDIYTGCIETIRTERRGTP